MLPALSNFAFLMAHPVPFKYCYNPSKQIDSQRVTK